MCCNAQSKQHGLTLDPSGRFGHEIAHETGDRHFDHHLWLVLPALAQSRLPPDLQVQQRKPAQGGLCRIQTGLES
jgi:hypothetical protein